MRERPPVRAPRPPCGLCAGRGWSLAWPSALASAAAAEVVAKGDLPGLEERHGWPGTAAAASRKKANDSYPHPVSCGDVRKVKRIKPDPDRILVGNKKSGGDFSPPHIRLSVNRSNRSFRRSYN